MTDPRTLPESAELERAVLAGILIEPRYLDELPIWGELFHSERHRTLLAAMAAVRAEGTPLDERTVQAQLEADGKLDDAGGVAYLASLVLDLPDLTRIAHYVTLLEDLRLRRELITLGGDLVRRGLADGIRPDQLIADVQSRILGLTEGEFQRGGPEPLGATALEMAEIYASLEPGKVVGLRTGFPDLDSIVGGFEPGRLIVIAGRPRMGKSVLGQQIAETQHQDGAPQLYMSLEMSREECATRSLVRRTGIPYQRMRSGHTSQGQRGQIRLAAREIVTVADAMVDDRAGLRCSQITLAARAVMATRELRVLWVDHLGLVHGDRRYESRTLEIGSITGALKKLAKDLGITVVALHQLNREVEKRADPRPMLSDLRESGSVEQDADVVIFVHRPELFDPDNEEAKGKAEFIVAKNRDGAEGTAEVLFDGPAMTFRSLERRYA